MVAWNFTRLQGKFQKSVNREIQSARDWLCFE